MDNPSDPNQVKARLYDNIMKAANVGMAQGLKAKYAPKPPSEPVAESTPDPDADDPETLAALLGE